MPSLLNSTKEALGGEALPHCQSRALRLTRYARPELNDKSQPTRHDFLQSVAAAQRTEAGLDSWRTWLGTAAKPEHTIHAKLEARLLINMGGTVLENAGLQLDRFGTAYLPGSAVKACARRTALAALHQWCETSTKPDAASDDALAPVCAPFAAPGDLLLAIIRVFGCTDLEWKTYEEAGNDLAWACAKQWQVLRDQTRSAINRDNATPDETAPTRRGRVAFLPAYPHTRPAADLELDVLTSHHPDYYGEKKDKQEKLIQPIATDTENPIPVYFPAVAAGAVYTFALLPVGPADKELIACARNWLATGLAVFGLGAKTAAGYGFFSNEVYDSLLAEGLAAAQAKQEEQKALRIATEKEQEAKRLANIQSDEVLLKKLRGMKEDTLRGRVKAYSFDPKFWPPNESERTWVTILRYVTQESTALWLKEKANEKSAITKAIRALSAKTKFPISSP
ncbi:MAG TPA: type III-B CRISPR module RAMP protein Cmr6 [Opitutaceae bacterium]|jgi:CRISPR type III-B/RAMP module RAMP protein Cmr6|nr:type III-B CRISPR module RAMP protein Cmr6 [Opitutaceae bacterium]